MFAKCLHFIKKVKQMLSYQGLFDLSSYILDKISESLLKYLIMERSHHRGLCIRIDIHREKILCFSSLSAPDIASQIFCDLRGKIDFFFICIFKYIGRSQKYVRLKRAPT